MSSTYTTNKLFEKPDYNTYVDTWNVPVNADLDLIDTALGGSTLLNVTGVAGDVTLTSTQYRPPQLLISGTLTANVRYVVPSGKGGQWTVTNSATGAFTITITSGAGGSNITLPSGTTMVSCDGSATGMRLSITSTAAAKVDSFSTGSTGLTVNQSTGAVQLAGTLNIANGGTGTTTAPTSGQLLIGKSDGTYTVANITAASGSGLSVYNDPAGGIQLNAASSTGGTVTSVNLLAGTTGLTVTSSTGGAIINSGTFTLGGVVNVASGGTNLSSSPSAGQLLIGNAVSGYSLGFITGTPPISVTSAAGSISIAFSGTLPVANGGTGTTTSTGSGSVVLSSSPTLSSPTFTTPILGTPISGVLTNCTGYSVSNLSGTINVANGGTGATTLTGYVKGNGTSAFTASSTIPVADINGTLGIGSGGTGATTAAAALTSLGGASLSANNILLGTQTAPQYILASNNAKFYSGTGGQAGYTIIDFNANSNLYYNGSNQYEFSIAGAKAFTIKPASVEAYAFNVYSDRALKEDIEPVTGALSRVLAYEPVTYRWVDQAVLGSQLQEGFIAQDVGTVNPTAVSYSDGMAFLNPIPIIADLVAAVQELSNRVQALEAKVGP